MVTQIHWENLKMKFTLKYAPINLGGIFYSRKLVKKARKGLWLNHIYEQKSNNYIFLSLFLVRQVLANDNYNGQAVYNGQAGTMMALGTLNPPQQGSIDKISTAGYSTLTNLVIAPWGLHYKWNVIPRSHQNNFSFTVVSSRWSTTRNFLTSTRYNKLYLA